MRILVAEDERINQLYMRHLLTAQGHEVTLVGDGEQAIERLSEAPYDLVIMDVQMPRLDGTEAMQRIRAGEAGEDRASVPIVALTAYALGRDPDRYRDAGFVDAVAKPLNEARLFALIEKVAAGLGRGKE